MAADEIDGYAACAAAAAEAAAAAVTAGDAGGLDWMQDWRGRGVADGARLGWWQRGCPFSWDCKNLGLGLQLYNPGIAQPAPGTAAIPGLQLLS